MMNAWLICTIIFGGMMSFSIGANDAANGLATSYGSGAASLWKILALGAVAEFIGAMFCANQVASTLGTEIVDMDGFSDEAKQIMMFSVSLASWIFIMTSSFSGMPISGTHSVVGALLGAGIVTTNVDDLNWKKLGWILFYWVVSPLTSAAIAYVLMLYVSWLTLDTQKMKYWNRLFWLQTIQVICLMAFAFVFKELIYKSQNLSAGVEDNLLTLGIAFIGSFIVSRLMMLSVLLYNSKFKASKCTKCGFFLQAVFLPFSFQFMMELTQAI